jgi:hypothetical protein
MTLDDERQRELLLSMLKSVNVPGAVLDEVYALKQSIMTAQIGAMGLLAPGQGD